MDLCWFHHRLVHESGRTLRFLDHDEVIAITPAGNVISSIIDPPSSIDTTITARNGGVGLAIDANTITPDWWNDPLHLGDIIGGLEWHDQRDQRDQHGDAA